MPFICLKLYGLILHVQDLFQISPHPTRQPGCISALQRIFQSNPISQLLYFNALYLNSQLIYDYHTAGYILEPICLVRGSSMEKKNQPLRMVNTSDAKKIKGEYPLISATVCGHHTPFHCDLNNLDLFIMLCEIYPDVQYVRSYCTTCALCWCTSSFNVIISCLFNSSSNLSICNIS